MSEAQWRPLFLRGGEGTTEFDVLHEGIPEWLDGSVSRWLMDRAAEGGQAMVLRLERRLHITLAAPNDRRVGTPHTPANRLLNRFWQAQDDENRLTLLDAILYDLQTQARERYEGGEHDKAERLIRAAQRLGELLAEGGSAWTSRVEDPAWCLARRVDEATAQLVDVITAPNTDAARKMRAAWQACYRHDPDPDLAYRNAVLAVEAVAIPLVVPKDTKATLGKVADHFRDAASRWSVGGLDAKQIASGETLHTMLRTLWHNQERHARSDGTIVDVSQAEAEAAVSLAVILVHWFTAGLVARVDPT